MITRRVVAGLVLLGSLAGCGSEGATDETSATSSAVMATDADAVTGHGPCLLLTDAEIAAATGTTPNESSEVRGGCRWADGSAPLLDIEVEGRGDDAASTFASRKDLYADPDAGDPGIGEDSFYDALDEGKVYWLQDGVIYDVWIQTTTRSGTERADARHLATLVSGRL